MLEDVVARLVHYFQMRGVVPPPDDRGFVGETCEQELCVWLRGIGEGDLFDEAFDLVV